MKREVLAILVLVITCLSIMTTSAFAEDYTGYSVSYNSVYSSDVEAAFKTASLSVNSEANTETIYVKPGKMYSGSDNKVPIMKKGDGVIIVYPDGFRQGDTKQVKKAVQFFIDSIKDSKIPADQQQSLMQNIQDVDSDVASTIIPMLFDSTKADLFTAYKWLYPLLNGLRVLFGIGSVAIILLLIGSTILDLAYIGLPMWREKQSGGDKAGKRPFGVSWEAMSTISEVEKNMEEYKNAYVIYFKRRALTYIVLAICLLYLIAGELGGLIQGLLNLASGIV